MKARLQKRNHFHSWKYALFSVLILVLSLFNSPDLFSHSFFETEERTSETSETSLRSTHNNHFEINGKNFFFTLPIDLEIYLLEGLSFLEQSKLSQRSRHLLSLISNHRPQGPPAI